MFYSLTYESCLYGHTYGYTKLSIFDISALIKLLLKFEHLKLSQHLHFYDLSKFVIETSLLGIHDISWSFEIAKVYLGIIESFLITLITICELSYTIISA